MKGQPLPRRTKGQPFHPTVRRPYSRPKGQPFPSVPAVPARPGPPPGPQALPYDPTYEAQVAAAARNEQLAAGQNLYQRQQLQQTYGFDNPSDPFNKAQMLERSYRQSQAGTVNALAGRGQLYAGSTQTALEAGQASYQRQYAGLRGEYQRALGGLTAQGQEAQNTFATATQGALADRIARAQAQRTEPIQAPGTPARPAQPLLTRSPRGRKSIPRPRVKGISGLITRSRR